MQSAGYASDNKEYIQAFVLSFALENNRSNVSCLLLTNWLFRGTSRDPPPSLHSFKAMRSKFNMHHSTHQRETSYGHSGELFFCICMYFICILLIIVAIYKNHISIKMLSQPLYGACATPKTLTRKNT